jgi:hypothetical protein
MSQTQTEERRSALDDFAAKAGMSQGELVPVERPSLPAQYDIPHGALDIRKPRDEARVRAKLREWAAMAGDAWFYRWPVRNKRKGTTEWVEGPSIKCANALVMAYGNCRVYPTRVIDEGSYWTISCVFIDFETGAETGRDFRQRKSAATMGDDRERLLDISFQIGESKALRNVIVNALEPYADFAVSEAKHALVDKIGKDLAGWKRQITERVSSRIDIARVEAIIGRKAKAWLAPDIARVIAMMSAVADGMATLDETFPPLREEERPIDKFASPSGATSAIAAEGSEDEGAGGGYPRSPAPVHSASAGPSTMTAGDEGAGATPSPPASDAPAPPLATRQEAIDKVLRAATDRDVDLDDRLANLDTLQPVWEERMPDEPAFVRELFKRATKVARGEVKGADARRYLEAL